MKITKKIIEEAKVVAKKDYETLMKKIDAYNPTYKRKWKKYEVPDKNAWGYALEGTPDKAFVFIFPDRVLALRQDKSVIKEWK